MPLTRALTVLCRFCCSKRAGGGPVPEAPEVEMDSSGVLFPRGDVILFGVGVFVGEQPGSSVVVAPLVASRQSVLVLVVALTNFCPRAR